LAPLQEWKAEQPTLSDHILTPEARELSCGLLKNWTLPRALLQLNDSSQITSAFITFNETLDGLAISSKATTSLAQEGPPDLPQNELGSNQAIYRGHGKAALLQCEGKGVAPSRWMGWAIATTAVSSLLCVLYQEWPRGKPHSVSVSPSRHPSQAVRIGIHCVLRWLLVGLSLGCVVPLEPGGAHGQLNTTNYALSVESEPRQLEECPFTLNMVDLYGDGWNGAGWTWTEDSTNLDADTGTLANGGSGTAPLCGGGCYTLSVSEGSYPTEVSWTIIKGDTGREEASGGAGESATVCSAAQPSLLPTSSPVPTVLPPTPMPTVKPTPSPTTAITVSKFSELSNAITSNAQINVVGNIVFTAAITISAAVNVAIRSSVGAVLIGGGFVGEEGGLFHIKGASDVTFTGLGFKSGSASSDGGCLFVTGSSNVEVDDADFLECIADVSYCL